MASQCHSLFEYGIVGQSSRIVDYLFVVLMHRVWHCMFYRCGVEHKIWFVRKKKKG